MLIEVKEFDERLYFAYMEYRRLKDDFMNYLSYVPLEEDHFTVYSPKLLSLITDVCEQILDCFEIRIRTPLLRMYGGSIEDERVIAFEKTRKAFIEKMMKRKEAHKSMNYLELHGFIKEQKEFYTTLANLEGNNIFVIPIQQFIQPFKPMEGKEFPSWWSVYNSLKHDRFSARKEGNLKISLHCLAALYRLVTYPHLSDSHPLLFAMHTVSKMDVLKETF